MMRSIVLALVLAAPAAWGQEGESAAAAETPAPAEAETPAPAETPAGDPGAASPGNAANDDAPGDGGSFSGTAEGVGEGTGATLKERIDAVSRKVFVREGRFELAPLAGVSVNDAFFLRSTVGGRASYHLFESLSLDFGAHMNIWPFALPAVRTVREQLNPIVDEFFVWGIADAGINFAPVYGKFALMSEWTVHFDTFLTAGVGGILENSGQTFWGMDLPALFDHPFLRDPRGVEPGQTAPPYKVYVPNIDPAAQIGFGGRIFLFKWMVLRAEIRNYLYPRLGDALFPPRKISQLPVRHLAMLHVGVGFYLPFDFEYKYEGARVVEP